MTQYIKDAQGHFRGSIGSGAKHVPPSEPLPPSGLDPEDFAWGEKADIAALLQGWEQFRDQNRYLTAETQELPNEVVSTGSYVGLYKAVQDEELSAFLTQSASNPVPLASARIPDAESALLTWESLHSKALEASRALDELEYSLAKRLDEEKILSATDEPAGIIVYPVGGIRYTQWRHEEMQTALVDSFTAQEESSSATTRQKVAAVVSEYSSYATPTYYRVSELESLGIQPGDYAEAGQDARRLVLKGLPDESEGASAVVLAAKAYANRDVFESALDRVHSLCSTISNHDIHHALTEYSALRCRVSHMRNCVDGLKEAAKRQLIMRNEETISLPSGTTFQVLPGRRVRSVDHLRVRPLVIEAISRDLGIPQEMVGRVVQRYETVARVSSYRLKALEKKAQIDVDNYTTVSQTPARIVSHSRENELGE